MRTRTVVIVILGAGVASSLGALLWLGNPPPATKALGSAAPSPVSAPVLASRLEPTVSPSAADDSEPPSHLYLYRHRKRVARADVDLGNLLRAQILEAMRSEFPAGQDQIDAWLAEWTQRDPAGAGRFAKSLSAGPWREVTLRKVVQVWTAQDEASAERWAARLPDESERASVAAAVCFQVAQSDARQAVEIAERRGLGAAPGAVLENLVQQWAGQDLPGAAAWISEQPAGEGRDHLVGRLAYVQSQTEPAAAASFVLEQVPAGPIQDEAVMSVLHQWALRDPAAATAWVNRFPGGALHDRAQAELQGLAEYSR